MFCLCFKVTLKEETYQNISSSTCMQASCVYSSSNLCTSCHPADCGLTGTKCSHSEKSGFRRRRRGHTGGQWSSAEGPWQGEPPQKYNAMCFFKHLEGHNAFCCNLLLVVKVETVVLNERLAHVNVQDVVKLRVNKTGHETSRTKLNELMLHFGPDFPFLHDLLFPNLYNTVRNTVQS